MILAAGCDKRGAAAPAPALYSVAVGSAVVRVEVAADEAARARGLSGRKELGENDGMIFVFPGAKRVSFWMKDTHVALDIAFITPDGRIAEMQEMKPLSLEAHQSKAAVLMALEMPSGWFGRSGVGVGDRIVLPPELDSIEAR